ncbi:MAG TPA: NADH-quinone oxidoreductase subunit C, partial [Burkholderiales bacterium]
MRSKLDELKTALGAALGERAAALTESLGELTLVVKAADYLPTAQTLRDDPSLRFEQLVDLCGVDYSAFAETARDGSRFGVVSHLLSVTRNRRLRLRVFA